MKWMHEFLLLAQIQVYAHSLFFILIRIQHSWTNDVFRVQYEMRWYAQKPDLSLQTTVSLRRSLWRSILSMVNKHKELTADCRGGRGFRLKGARAWCRSVIDAKHNVFVHWLFPFVWITRNDLQLAVIFNYRIHQLCVWFTLFGFFGNSFEVLRLGLVDQWLWFVGSSAIFVSQRRHVCYESIASQVHRNQERPRCH